MILFKWKGSLFLSYGPVWRVNSATIVCGAMSREKLKLRGTKWHTQGSAASKPWSTESEKGVKVLVTQSYLFATSWTVVHQVPLSMKFSRQENWSWLPCPSPGDLPDPGIEPRSPALQAEALTSEPPGKPLHWHSDIYIWRGIGLYDAGKCRGKNAYFEVQRFWLGL